METVSPTTRWFERTLNPPRMVTTERDRRILDFAHQHRLISTEHIFTLLGATSQGQVRKVRKRLRLLYDHRFLDLPPLQTLDHRRKGSVPKVYALARNCPPLFIRGTQGDPIGGEWQYPVSGHRSASNSPYLAPVESAIITSG